MTLTIPFQSTSTHHSDDSDIMLSIFPNPATGKLSFNIDLKEIENYRIRIFDNTGNNLSKNEIQKVLTLNLF